MLPTSGYFRSVTCPFFTNGLCERPHCHFRHVNTESSAAAMPAKTLQADPLPTLPEPSTSLLSGSSKPDLLLLVREAILQVQKEVEADKGGGEGGQPSSSVSSLLPLAGSLRGSDPPPPSAKIPSDIDHDDDDDDDDDAEQASNFVPLPVRPAVVNVAEYRPTPIAQLKKLQTQSNKSGSSEYAPTSKASSKILYIPESKSRLPDAAVAATVSYIPNPIKKTCPAVVAARSGDSDSDGDDDVAGGAAFSDIDDDTAVPSREGEPSQPNSSEESATSSQKGERGTKFDLVNKILSESVAFDSLLSAASARRVADGEKSNSSVVKSKTTCNGSKESGIKSSSSSSDKKVASKNTKTVSAKAQQAVKAKPVTKKATSSTQSKKSTSVETKTSTVSTTAAAVVVKQGNPKVKTKSADQGSVLAKKSAKTKVNSSPVKKVAGAVVANATTSPGVDKKNKNKVSSTTGDSSMKRNSLNESVAKRQKTEHGVVQPAKTTTPPRVSVSSEATMLSEQDTTCESDDADDENNVDEECLKIFNEYIPQVEPNVSSSKKALEKNKNDDADVAVAPAKIRVARNPNQNAVQRTVPVAKYRASPSQIMYERFLRVQQMVLEGREKNSFVEAAQPRSERFPSCEQSSLDVPGKQRIAHVPNGMNTPTIKSKRPASLSSKSGSTLPSTSSRGTTSNNTAAVSATSAKGSQRVTQPPKSSFVRPTIPAEFGSKVPTNIRQRYLNFIINECLVIYDNEQDACERALVEEKIAYDRSVNRTVYLNVVANAIKKLRDEQPKGSTKSNASVGTAATQQRVVSHQFNLGGKKAANVSYSIERLKNKCADLNISGVHLYKALKRYILNEEQLVENGFPLQHPTEPFVTVIIKSTAKRNTSTDPLDKVCSRCGSTFKVAENGVFITKEECFYHWGRAHKTRTGGGYEIRYSCCQAGLHSEGCCVGKLHVYDDIDPLNLRGFVKTLPKSPPPDDNYGVFALDCEMCYTNMGTELTRITVVDSNSKPVFESLVKPENAIIDYNTRFSGITEADLRDVRTTLRDVQAIILNKFSDKTILIGHSLESDFKALKLMHKTVVDTSVVFPHKMGPPCKRALRSLVAEFLKKIIQNDVDGHDSQEDAASCMQLMMWKIKEDSKMVY